MSCHPIMYDATREVINDIEGDNTLNLLALRFMYRYLNALQVCSLMHL